MVKDIKQIFDKFKPKEGIIIHLRECDDISKFIKVIQEAHEKTKNSTLHFRG